MYSAAAICRSTHLPIPQEGRIITSDDVFGHLPDIRCINGGIDAAPAPPLDGAGQCAGLPGVTRYPFFMSSSLSGASTGKSLLDVIMRFFSEAVNPPVQCGTVDFSRDEGITFCAFSQRSIYFPPHCLSCKAVTNGL